MPEISELFRSHAEYPELPVNIGAVSRRAEQRTMRRRAAIIGGAGLAALATVLMAVSLWPGASSSTLTADRPDSSRRPAQDDQSLVPLGPMAQPVATTQRPPRPTCELPDVGAPRPDQHVVTVYFYCGGEAGASHSLPLLPVRRLVPKTGGPLLAALQALVDGPTEVEHAAGLRAGVPKDALTGPPSASVDRGIAVVDIPIDQDYPNLSTTEVSSTLYVPILATTLAVPGVEALSMAKLCKYLSDTGCDGNPPIVREWRPSPVTPVPPIGPACPQVLGAAPVDLNGPTDRPMTEFRSNGQTFDFLNSSRRRRVTYLSGASFSSLETSALRSSGKREVAGQEASVYTAESVTSPKTVATWDGGPACGYYAIVATGLTDAEVDAVLSSARLHP